MEDSHLNIRRTNKHWMGNILVTFEYSPIPSTTKVVKSPPWSDMKAEQNQIESPKRNAFK